MISPAAVALVCAGFDALTTHSDTDHRVLNVLLDDLEEDELRAAADTLVLLVVMLRQELAGHVDDIEPIDEWLARLGMQAAEAAAWT